MAKKTTRKSDSPSTKARASKKKLPVVKTSKVKASPSMKSRTLKPAAKPAAIAPKKKAPAKPIAAAKPVKAVKTIKPVKAIKPLKTVKSIQRVKAAKPAPAPVREVIEAKPAVATTATKPGKNQAGIGARELEMYRDLLMAKRRELFGDVDSMEDEALRNAGSNLSNLPIHMADMGTDNYEQEFTLGLVEKDRNLLREIHAALAKIQDGTFGICENTGKPISKARLEAQPWTRFSIEHARRLEQRKLR